MVDINLFKDEDEDDLEPKPNQDINLPLDDVDDFLSDSSGSDTGFSDSDLLGSKDTPDPETSNADLSDLDLGGDDIGGSDFGGKLDFEEDIPDFEDSTFGSKGAAQGDVDDSFLDDEFGDLPEDETVDDASDYAFGEVRKKSTPVWIWILFLVIVGGVCLYLFVLQPRMVHYKTVTVKQPAVTIPDSSALARTDSAQGASDSLSSTAAAQQPRESANESASRPGAVRAVAAADIGSKSAYASAALRILAEFSKTSQFGSVLLSGARFVAVEYVSETPNVSVAMGHKIGTLLNLKAVKTSPEDRHRIRGKLLYFGVVSGTLPGDGGGGVVGQTQTYAEFIRDLKNSIRQHGLTLTDIQKLNEKQVNGHSQTDIRINCSGSKAGVSAFLPAIGRIKDNIYITKLFLTPSAYNDFKAETVKLVLEFRLVS